MSAYPTLTTIKESTVKPVDSRVVVRATNGAVKVRVMHPTEKVEIDLIHVLDSSGKDDLDTHYAANSDSSFSYTWRGQEGGTYTVVYMKRPEYREQDGQWFQARVRLAEV